MKSRTLIFGLLILCTTYTLSACGRNREQSLDAIAPTIAPATTNQPDDSAPDASTSDAKVKTEFLGLAGGQAYCDHPPEAKMTCSVDEDTLHLEIDINASTYARWQVKWDNKAASALTGNETLYLHAKRNGEATPNLYLVENDGERIAVNLGKYGLKERWSDIVIPLAEFKDQEGNRPDFADVNEIQIVFEWSDMRGELMIDALRFEKAWVDKVALSQEALSMAQTLTVPEGFVIEPIIDAVSAITQIQFAPDGSMLISLQPGRIWWYEDMNGDGVYDLRRLYAAGRTEIVGLLYDPLDGAVWFGGRGKLYRTADTDGNGAADLFELRIDGLPWGRHQNNGLVWGPDPDPFTGEEGIGWIYFGLGSTDDLEVGGERNATVLRFPRAGQSVDDLEIVSRGNRNAYDLTWAQVPLNDTATAAKWALFASENGPDFNNAPDEINHIRWQHHYGFPEKFGTSFDEPESKIDNLPYSGSLYPVTAHASANGLTYITNPAWPAAYRTLYVSLFGQVFSEEIVGHTVDRIELAPEEDASGATFRGEPSTFIDGLDRPLPLTTDNNGDMIVGDYAQGIVYRVRYIGAD